MIYESALQNQTGPTNASSSCWARCRALLHLDSSSAELSKDQSSGSDLQATPISLSPTNTGRDTPHARPLGQTNTSDSYGKRNRAAKVGDVQTALLELRREGSAEEEEEDDEDEEEDEEERKSRFKAMARSQVARLRENNFCQTSRSRLINQRTISEEREEENDDSETTMSSQQHIDYEDQHFGQSFYCFLSKGRK